MGFSNLHHFIANLAVGQAVELVSFGSVFSAAVNGRDNPPVHHGSFIVRSITKGNGAYTNPGKRVELVDPENPRFTTVVESMTGWDANCDGVQRGIRPAGHDYIAEWDEAVLQKRVESIRINELSDEKRALLLEVLG